MADLERSTLRRVGVAVVCARLAFVPLALDPGSDWPFIVPKALLGHALGLVLLAVMIAVIIRFGWAALPRSALHVPVLVYVGTVGIATAFAVDRYVALYGTHERMLGLATIADWVALYFGTVTFLRTRSDAVAAALAIFVPAVIVLEYEIVQIIGRDPIAWNIVGTANAFSTIGQPTSLGQYTSTLAVASFLTAMMVPTLTRVQKVALLVLAAALTWGIGATDSRAPIVGLVAGSFVLVIAVLTTRSAQRDRRIALYAMASVGVVVTALLVLTPIGTRVAETLPLLTGGEQSTSRAGQSVATRIALYEIGLQEFLERPLVGYGPDNFVVGVPRYRPERAPVEVRQSAATSAHSWLIQSLAGTGLLGTLALLACFGIAVVVVARSHFAPVPLIGLATLAAYLGTGLTTVDDLATGWMPWVCLGVIASSTATVAGVAVPSLQTARGQRSRRKHAREAAARPSDAQRIAILIALSAGLVAAAAPLAAYSASRSAKTSSDVRLVGRTADAIKSASSAVGSDAGRPEYWQVLGFAYVSAARWRDAASAFDHAATLEPYDVRHVEDLISASIASGDATLRGRLRELAERIVRIDPNNPGAQLSNATTMQFLGSQRDAEQAVQRALDLDPGSSNVQMYVTAAQIFINGSRAMDAERASREGIAIIDATEITLRSVPLRYEHARALASLGRVGEALKELDLVLALQPHYPEADVLRTQLRALSPP